MSKQKMVPVCQPLWPSAAICFLFITSGRILLKPCKLAPVIVCLYLNEIYSGLQPESHPLPTTIETTLLFHEIQYIANWHRYQILHRHGI